MNVVITGASSGLGQEIVNQLLDFYKDTYIKIYNLDIEESRIYKNDERVVHCPVDLSSPKQIFQCCSKLPEKIDILINNCGINYIEYIEKFDMDKYNLLFDINVKAGVLLVKYNLDRLRDGTVLNIISNASDVAMTNSLAYNGSKAALKGITKQMSRELSKTHNITVFGVSPNRIAGTGMSNYIDEKVCELRGWDKETARKYQLSSIPAGEETDKGVLAEFIGFLLSDKIRHKYLQGCILNYGAPTAN